MPQVPDNENFQEKCSSNGVGSMCLEVSIRTKLYDIFKEKKHGILATFQINTETKIFHAKRRDNSEDLIKSMIDRIKTMIKAKSVNTRY